MGYYIIGNHTSRSWHGSIEDAKQELKKILALGAWQGTKPRIEADKDSLRNCSICRGNHGLERIHKCE